MESSHPTEKAPLLIQQQSSTDSSPAPEPESSSDRGRARLTETVLNLAKTCAGTGCLALPYACKQGGALVFVTGLLAIAAWNVYGVDRLVRCARMIQHHTQSNVNNTVQLPRHDSDEPDTTTLTSTNLPQSASSSHQQSSSSQSPPPSTASTLGKVAWVACGGSQGLLVMDIMMVILLLGIVISYLSAVISFLSDTPLTLGPIWDALIVALCMACLSMVPDLGYLSKASAIGLAVLGATFAVITGYGIFAEHETHDNDAPPLLDNDSSIPTVPLWPLSLVGLSRFFGVCVFGYGVVPLTFNFQEAMKEPNRMVEATWIAMTLVAIGYSLIGVVLLALFGGNVQGEVLHELPAGGWLPTVTRLAMASVCIMTAPLIIVPTGELIEAKLEIAASQSSGSTSNQHHKEYRYLVRGGVCLVSAIVAVLLPTFVQVLSFVGCLCVGLVGFVVPPFLHLRLMHLKSSNGSLACTSPTIFVDVVMLVWGLMAILRVALLGLLT